MKTIFGIVVPVVAALFALNGCSQSDEQFYHDSATIYFDLSGASRDSIVYSFAKTTAKEHVVEIPLEIAGYSSDADRIFRVVVDAQSSTAKEELHYKPLDEHYVLPAGSFRTVLPVTVYSADPLLEEKAVDIRLKIVPTDDFQNEMADRQQARIRVSNMLEKPRLWDNVYGPKHFGPYSKVKYKLILEVCGIDEIPAWGSSNRQLLVGYGFLMQNYFLENYPVYDENGQVIEYNWNISY